MTQHGTGNIRLVELDEAAYREYREHLVRDYAADKVRAGAWSEAEAGSRAANDVDGLLPEGMATRNHFLYSIRDESAAADVGTVWFVLMGSGVGRSVWIYDIVINETFRRRGYATRTLKLVEDRAGELGARSVELHIFGHNRGAQALYEKMGYGITSITMAKPILTEQS